MVQFEIFRTVIQRSAPDNNVLSIILKLHICRSCASIDKCKLEIILVDMNYQQYFTNKNVNA